MILPCHCYDFPNFFPLFSSSKNSRKILQIATFRSDYSLILFLTIWPWPSDQTLMKMTPCSSTDHKLSGGMRFSNFLSPNFAPSLDSDPTTYFYIIRDINLGYEFEIYFVGRKCQNYYFNWHKIFISTFNFNVSTLNTLCG